MSHKPLFGSASHLANMGSWKAGSPASNPQRLKVAKSWISTSFHWLAGVATQDNRDHNQYPVVPHLGYHNSIFCKHYATILSWWSVLPLSRTLSFWKGVEAYSTFHKRHGFLRQTCHINLFFGSASHLANMGSWKAGSPASNPQRLKVAKSWISTSLHWLAGVAIKAIKSCCSHLGYHNSIFGKHYATILSWWSVLPLSRTSSFWKGVEAYISQEAWIP